VCLGTEEIQILNFVESIIRASKQFQLKDALDIVVLIVSEGRVETPKYFPVLLQTHLLHYLGGQHPFKDTQYGGTIS
jgi:hypothetical protein